MPLYLKYKILDEKGKVEREGICHSWVKQFVQQLAIRFDPVNQTYVEQIKDTSGTLRSVTQYSYDMASYPCMRINAGGSVITHGIVVGTGTNAESPDDYQLQTIIGTGTGSGQLTYGAMTWSASTVQGTNIIIIGTRPFTNGSGATVTINEIGIYALCYSVTTAYYFCFARDKLTSGVDVIAGATKTIVYTVTESNS